MSSDGRFGIYPGSFVHAGGTLDLAQLARFGYQLGATKKEIIPGGSVDVAAVLMSHADPKLMASTADLSTLLGTISLNAGLNITGAATMRLQERTQGGTFESGATHETFTASKGFLCVDSITATQDDADGAMAELAFVPLYDGSNVVVAHNTGVNFNTAPVPAFGSQYFLGPIYHNGSELGRITRVTIRSGIQFGVKRTSGDPYPKSGAIITRPRKIEFTSLKIDDNGGLNLFSRGLAGTLAVYLWKGANDSDRVAVGSSAHIKISCSAGNIGVDSIEVSENDDGTITYSITPTSAFTVSTASTIP